MALQLMTKIKPLTGALSATSGIVINFISALFIKFHHNAQTRSLIYFNQLVRNLQLGCQFALALSMENKELENSQKAKIIDHLLEAFKNETGKIFVETITGGDRKKTRSILSKVKKNRLLQHHLINIK